MQWHDRNEAGFPAYDPAPPIWVSLIIAALIGGLLAATAYLIVSNLPAASWDVILDFLSPDRHTTLEQAVARIEARL